MTLSLRDGALLRQQAYIDGQWARGAAGATCAVRNPATGDVIASVPDLGATETREAIDAASRAFPAWSKRTAQDRALILRRWFELMMANQDDLARLMTAEQGKPLAEARGEIAYAAAYVEWFAEEARRVYGDLIPSHQVDKRLMVLRQPSGSLPR